MAERFIGPIKFDFNRSYPRDEFLFLCDTMLMNFGTPGGLREILSALIDLVEKYPTSATVKWGTMADGSIYVYQEKTS